MCLLKEMQQPEKGELTLGTGTISQALRMLIDEMIKVWTSLVAQTVKRLSTMRETWVRSLGWEDSLEKETATHSSTLA